MKKIAVKYLPGCGGEFILSLIASIQDNKPFELNEKNHYHCTDFDCGHQSFRKFFTNVYLTDRPDYPSLVSDSVGKGSFEKNQNIFKHYSRITMHLSYSEKEWDAMLYRKINEHSETTALYNYAKKGFKVVETDYESLYNNTFEGTKALIKSFCDVSIDESHYILIRKYYEKNQSIIDSYLSNRTD